MQHSVSKNSTQLSRNNPLECMLLAFYIILYKTKYLVKSVFRAPVPAYCLAHASALSAQTKKQPWYV